MRAWIAGATGVVGQQLLDLALADARVERMLSLVRRPTGRAHPRLVERVVAFDRLREDLAGEQATHVFCCLGTTMAKAGSEAAFRTVDHDYPVALAQAALGAGVRAFLVITAIGANPESRVFYSRV